MARIKQVTLLITPQQAKRNISNGREAFDDLIRVRIIFFVFDSSVIAIHQELTHLAVE